MPICKFDGCGSNKIENRDIGFCATHNSQRIKAERVVAVREPKPIPKISAKRTAALKERAKAYKVVKAEQQQCACCGDRSRLTPSHVLSQKHFPELAANPRNIVVLCVTDHTLWEHHKEQFALMFPDVWALKMEIMEELAPAEFQRFKAKHSNLF